MSCCIILVFMYCNHKTKVYNINSKLCQIYPITSCVALSCKPMFQMLVYPFCDDVALYCIAY